MTVFVVVLFFEIFNAVSNVFVNDFPNFADGFATPSHVISGIKETMLKFLCLYFVTNLEHGDDLSGINFQQLTFIA